MSDRNSDAWETGGWIDPMDEPPAVAARPTGEPASPGHEALIWGLTTRTRELGERIHRKILEPSRHAMTEAARRLGEVAKTKQAAYAAIDNQVNSLKQEATALYNTARNHLQSQNAFPVGQPAQLTAASSSEAEANA